MKARTGFVSNSSTTSFTCDVCGHSEGFSDSIGYDEMGFVQCLQGHGLCKEHIIEGAPEKTIEEMRETLRVYAESRSWKEYDSEWDDDTVADTYDDWLYEYDITEQQCPICQFQTISQRDAQKYILKLTREGHTDFLGKIAYDFDTYAKFREWLDED